MNPEQLIFYAIFCVVVLFDYTQGQTKFSVREEKSEDKKRDEKKEPPTFIGSDGVVRKVSPAAILEEMKRCLPPGILIPIAAWPELPHHLETLQEANHKTDYQGTLDQRAHDLKEDDRAKRVSRSNDKSFGEMGVDAPDQSMNVKLEGPSKESGGLSSVISHNKMADVLKDMLARQVRRSNLTAEYVDDSSLRPRVRKPKKIDDYDEYDYIDTVQPKPTVRAKIRHSRRHVNSFPTSPKRRRKTKRENELKHNLQNPSSKLQMSRLKKKQTYDYYDDSNEDYVHEKYNQRQQLSHIQSDELEKQIELNDFLEKHLNDEIPEKIGNIDKWINIKATSEESDVVEGYQKMLAVIMKLNTTLIHLLDKFSSMLQKQPNDAGLRPTDDAGKSSVIWDFMDLLMQQRKGSRSKRENGPYVPINSDPNPVATGSSSASDDAVKPPSEKRKTMDLLKWLLKWYLSATSK